MFIELFENSHKDKWMIVAIPLHVLYRESGAPALHYYYTTLAPPRGVNSPTSVVIQYLIAALHQPGPPRVKEISLES